MGGRLTRSGIVAIVVVVVLLVALIAAGIASSSPSVHTSSRFVAGTPEGSTPVNLDTTLYVPEKTPAPAILLAHGFGGTKQSVAGEARTLAQNGFVVLTWTARGFGRSGGLIHLDSPQYEVQDASLLVTYLSTLKQVDASKIGVAGASYGGGLALLLAAYDKRIKAVDADITWNSLVTALFPNAAGTGPGVFKKLWAGYLFQGGFASGPFGGGTPQCGRFAPDVCAGYQQAAATGQPDAALLRLLNASSPSTVLTKITAPTLLSQGEDDSLFPLSEVDANARGIAAHGTTVKVVWHTGGHDGGESNVDLTALGTSWFKDVFAGRIHGTQKFELGERGGTISSESGRAHRATLQASGYPGIDGVRQQTSSVTVAGPAQTIAAPAGGNPASINALPVLGGLLNQAGGGGGGGSGGPPFLSTLPGQAAFFVSKRLPKSVLIAGSPTITVRITSQQGGDAVLFAGLRDVSSSGSSTLPSQLVAPIRLTGLRPGVPRTVTVHLPAIVRNIPTKDSIAVTFSTTDLAYATPAQPRTYTVSLVGDTASVALPTTSGAIIRAGHPGAWLLVGAGLCVLCALGVAVELRRRRRVLRPDPSLADVPVAITSLVKEYAGGYLAVDDVTFQVQRGQVVGLLGPNGAGKTTVLRVLVGLITPTSGTVHMFGEPVLPGASVLARQGAFIEGPGFLPHLSGRENLRIYWAATGRPAAEADFDTALQIAGLGPSIDRRVKTYSHGMKQRLGIAQAMLGLPELLVLDEPTNGLDPPQIAEMREVLQSYARTGRTVVVSSHLLAEVEQTCTHVVVMHKGKLVAAGSVAEIAGAGNLQLVVPDARAAADILARAGITAEFVPARRALEDVFLELVGEDL